MDGMDHGAAFGRRWRVQRLGQEATNTSTIHGASRILVVIVAADEPGQLRADIKPVDTSDYGANPRQEWKASK